MTVRHLFMIALTCLCFGCVKKAEEEKILLPPTPVLSIRSNWAVVTSTFLRIREEPFSDAKILTHLRKGYILEILSRTQKKESVEDQISYWYRVSFEGLRGWVFGAYLEILDSRTQAESFAAELE